MLGNMEKSKENAGEHGKIERKCWGIWKNVRNMLENMGIKRKSKIYAPNNAGSSLVSQRYMQVIPKKNSYFKDENTIHVFPPKKRDFTPNRVVYNTGETCKLPTNMRCIKKITAFGRIFMFAAYM